MTLIDTEMRLIVALMLLVLGIFIRGEQFCTDPKDPQFRLPVGQQGPGPLGQCIFVKCEKVVDNKPILTAIGCGVFIPTPGCNISDYDKTKLYPACCPNEVC